MNETVGKIVERVQAELDKGPFGKFSVQAKIVEGPYTRESRDPRMNLQFITQNENGETNVKPVEEFIDGALARALPGLAAYVDFTPPKPDKERSQKWAADYDAVMAEAAAAGIALPKAIGDWARERARLAQLQETADQPVPTPEGFAVTTNRSDTSVNAMIVIPNGISADAFEKKITERSDAIKTLLGRMVAKKITQDPNEQAAIIEKVRQLEIIPTTQSYGSGYNMVNIEIRSKQVTDAMKEQGGLAALSKEKIATLKDSNPLMLLNDGDGLTKENPAQLKMAVSRAILFEGEKGEKPIEEYPLLAGSKDIKTLLEKTKRYLERNKPELVEKLDTLIKSPVFENYWGSKNTDGTPKKIPIETRKRDDRTGYVEGQFQTDLSIPTDKLSEVLAALAAGPAADQQTTGATLATTEPAQAPAAASTEVSVADADKKWTEQQSALASERLAPKAPAATAAERVAQQKETAAAVAAR